jgi:acylphosphatase
LIVPIVAKRVRIEGRVQGVWYRGWTVEQASARGLLGWVRNRRDGSVEAVFCGPEDIVDDLISLCWKGPLAARVTGVALENVDETAVGPGATIFTQLPTE